MNNQEQLIVIVIALSPFIHWVWKALFDKKTNPPEEKDPFEIMYNWRAHVRHFENWEKDRYHIYDDQQHVLFAVECCDDDGMPGEENFLAIDRDFYEEMEKLNMPGALRMILTTTFKTKNLMYKMVDETDFDIKRDACTYHAYNRGKYTTLGNYFRRIDN